MLPHPSPSTQPCRDRLGYLQQKIWEGDPPMVEGQSRLSGAPIRHGFGCACHPQLTYKPVSRRHLLAGAAAFGAASLLPRAVRGEGAGKVIDTHHHFYPPAYQKAWLDWEDARKIPHFASQVGWTREKAIEQLDRGGIRTGILSLASTPGLWFDRGPEEAARMVRIS